MAANIAKVLGFVLTLVGVEVAEDELVTAIGGVMFLASVGVSVYDRYSKGDIHWFGKRK